MSENRSPSMQFYFRQFAGDEHVMAMDLDAVGAHILLMCAAGASSSGYRLRADDRALRTVLRNPSEEDWQRIKKQLLAGAWKLSEDRQWWVQDGQRRTLLKQKQYKEEQKRKAKLGAAARWAQSGHESGHTPGINGAMPQDASLSSPLPLNQLLEPPYPPSKTKGENSVVFEVAGRRIAVVMGRHKRLPRADCCSGGQPEDYVAFYQARGFEARFVE